MVQKVNVFYEGWGARVHWGTLATAPGSPIVFEYTAQAIAQKIDLSPHNLPLRTAAFNSSAFPAHQSGLPGPVYDALPDGWGLLLMDRVFEKRNLALSSITPLDRLAFVGDSAMGALTFEPEDVHKPAPSDIPMAELAQEAQEVLKDRDTVLLPQLALVGGSPGGARPKALVYYQPGTDILSTIQSAGAEPWLIKFPARDEHIEVCALEELYAHLGRMCGIDTPECKFIPLSKSLSAFATKRFDRSNGMRVPTLSLAALSGANFRMPGSFSYKDFLRATWIHTKDMQEVLKAFQLAVFNVAFNNRDDHVKNFGYVMDRGGAWKLAPAYDLTYCEGPGGEHQMDVMGEGRNITRQHLLELAETIKLNPAQVAKTIQDVSSVAAKFKEIAKSRYPKVIRPKTVNAIAQKLAENVARLK